MFNNMNKIIIYIIFILAGQAVAQNGLRGELLLGGGTVGFWHPIPPANYTLPVGAQVGLGLRVPINRRLVLRSSVLVERKLLRSSITFTDAMGMPVDTEKIAIAADYITVPIVLTYSLSAHSPLFVGAGGYVSGLVSAKQTLDVGGANERQFDIRRSYNPIDAGLIAAFGMAETLPNEAGLTVQLRVSLGCVGMLADPAMRSFSTNWWGFGLLASYTLP